MENLEKSWNFKMVISRPGKVTEKNLNHKSFGKVLEMCYNFEIINMFFKERRSKYKPAYALNTQNVLYFFVYTELSVWSWKFVLKSCKSPGNPLAKCVRTLLLVTPREHFLKFGSTVHSDSRMN